METQQGQCAPHLRNVTPRRRGKLTGASINHNRTQMEEHVGKPTVDEADSVC